MEKISQVGIAIIALGLVVAFIGLFPGVIGMDQSPGVGILQILVILFGFTVMTLGAYIFVKFTFYPHTAQNLAQEIGIRISLTGLLIATASGLTDVLGFGSHPPGPDQRPFVGTIQTIGLVGGFVLASLGVVIFVLMGDHPSEDKDSSKK